jgi:hypothetical protein
MMSCAFLEIWKGVARASRKAACVVYSCAVASRSAVGVTVHGEELLGHRLLCTVVLWPVVVLWALLYMVRSYWVTDCWHPAS